MTEQQIIEWDNIATELATEQFPKKVDADDWWLKHCTEFANLVAAHAKAEERERCAKVCDAHTVDDVLAGIAIGQSCAAAIRALKD